MAAVEALVLRNVRNLEEEGWQPGSRANVYVGGNGAGKTSILEGLYLLAYGRSFRTGRLREVCRRGAEGMAVEGRVRLTSGANCRVGFSFVGGASRVRWNGRGVERQGEVARKLPTGLFVPDQAGLVWGSPETRRRFLDWVLFHVEPGYGSRVQRYRHVLRQRNQCLRDGASDRVVGAWTEALVELGESISADRERVVAEVGARLAGDRRVGVGGAVGVELGYAPGFRPAGGLAAELGGALANDRKRGFTSVGPHAGDIRVRALATHTAGKMGLSRGQGKTVGLALLVEGARYIQERSGEAPCLLVDDYNAELDADAEEDFLRRVVESGFQAHLTSVRGGWPPDLPEPTVFHVKHGRIERT